MNLLKQVEVKQTKTEINPDVVKEVAILLLQGKYNMTAWEIETGYREYSETVELLLPEGFTLTIKRESY